MANIPYKSLWRFLNNINTPNYETLEKLATFFNLSISELLNISDNKLNQIPIISVDKVQNFINNTYIADNHMMLDEYVNDTSFALKIEINNQNNIYIFTPFNKIIKAIVILQNKITGENQLVKIFDITQTSIDFIPLITKDNKQEVNTLNITSVIVLAIAVKKIITTNLLSWE